MFGIRGIFRHIHLDSRLSSVAIWKMRDFKNLLLSKKKNFKKGVDMHVSEEKSPYIL